jgi:uncharacterized membrane protein
MKVLKDQPKRILELDVLRGLAIVGMIIYHIGFSLDFYGIQEIAVREGGWAVLRRSVQFSFLGLVGILLFISKKTPKQQTKRAFIVFVCALIITQVTWIVIPDFYVRFGILHLIATSIVMMSFFSQRPYYALAIGCMSLILGTYIKLPAAGASIDYFPIFPWLGVVAFGVFIGNMLYKKRTPLVRLKKNILTTPLSFLGRHSLIVYMVHVPMIIAALVIIGILPLERVL